MIQFKPTGYYRIGHKQVFTLKCESDLILDQIQGQIIQIDNNQYKCIEVERNGYAGSVIVKGEKLGLIVEICDGKKEANV